jgi:hypothetical protein
MLPASANPERVSVYIYGIGSASEATSTAIFYNIKRLNE